MPNLTPRQRLDALIDLLPDDIRSAFHAAIQDIVDNTVISSLTAAIEAGDAVAAFKTLGFGPAAMRPLTAAIERAYETAGVLTGETFPKVLNTPSGKAVFRFDVRNTRAETWLRDRSSTLIERISDETQRNIRNVLTTGMEEGRNPRNVALDIVGRIDPVTKTRSGGLVGLTENQEFWVQSARAKLVQLDRAYFNMALRDKRFDPTVLKAIEKGEALPSDTVDKLVGRYRDNALKYRGEVIGRTEALRSLNAAEWEAAKQAVDMGATKASAVKREWDDAGDGRVRPSHKALNGQQVGLDEPFTSPVTGAQMMYPGDTSLGAGGDDTIQCRCRARTVVDWFDDLD